MRKNKLRQIRKTDRTRRNVHGMTFEIAICIVKG